MPKTRRQSAGASPPLTTLSEVVKRLDARNVERCGFAVGDRVVHKDEPGDVGTIRRVWACDWSHRAGEIDALVVFAKGGRWGGPISVLRHVRCVKPAREKKRRRAR